MKIEICSAEVTTQQGTVKNGARAGQQYSLRKQQAFCHIEGQKYPSPFTLVLPDDVQVYQPGLYNLQESSFYVDKYGQLALGSRLVLQRIGGETVRAAS